ncbi:MAG: hemerythrin family protein [Patescibacteria group bacterium]|nr:hemerythrin family protein [Patescibacteria group bacterium]MDE1946091.1 hemerythrin family protein [Patescibacteria group bacterium]
MISSFEWTKDMSVGDETIDRQHQQLLKEIDILLSVLIAGADETAIASAVAFLSDYIATHLAYEEEYMRQHGYPDIDFHISLHRDFIDHYELFKKEVTDGVPRKELISEIAQYVGAWWLKHILIEDKKYARYVAEHRK